MVGVGTAITVDVVTRDGVYLGGTISPGLRTSTWALSKRTSLLPDVDVSLWGGFDELHSAHGAGAAFHFLTTKSSVPYWSVAFSKGDFLVFGSETRGLPASLLEAHRGQCITIPMQGTRSLNLATATGIVLYEAVRQIELGA